MKRAAAGNRGGSFMTAVAGTINSFARHNTPMVIRPARPEDAEAACVVMRRSIVELCQLDHQNDAATVASWTANKTADTFRRWIEQSHVFVATEADRVVGVAAIKDSGEIVLNYVSPDARFRGVSRALVRRLEQQARELGLRAVTLNSTKTAQRFYKSAGYRNTGEPTKGFGVADGYPMTKML